MARSWLSLRPQRCWHGRRCIATIRRAPHPRKQKARHDAGLLHGWISAPNGAVDQAVVAVRVASPMRVKAVSRGRTMSCVVVVTIEPSLDDPATMPSRAVFAKLICT
jgi:hypothetical protein